MGTALDHFPADRDAGHFGIKAFALATAPGIFGHTTGPSGLDSFSPPIIRPLPDIADHVVQAVTIGWKCGHRRRSITTIGPQIAVGKMSAPKVRHDGAAGT